MDELNASLFLIEGIETTEERLNLIVEETELLHGLYVRTISCPRIAHIITIFSFKQLRLKL